MSLFLATPSGVAPRHQATSLDGLPKPTPKACGPSHPSPPHPPGASAAAPPWTPGPSAPRSAAPSSLGGPAPFQRATGPLISLHSTSALSISSSSTVDSWLLSTAQCRGALPRARSNLQGLERASRPQIYTTSKLCLRGMDLRVSGTCGVCSTSHGTPRGRRRDPKTPPCAPAVIVLLLHIGLVSQEKLHR